jgi:hypothetical protein
MKSTINTKKNKKGGRIVERRRKRNNRIIWKEIESEIKAS